MNQARVKRVKKAHRNVGVVLLVFLVIFAVTGIMLNHSDDLDLASRPVPAFIAGWYYDELATSGFKVQDRFVYAVDTEVYLDRQAVTVCADALRGAIDLEAQIVVLCGKELLIVSSGGELIERLGSVHGVPEDIARLGRLDGRLVLETGDSILGFDTGSLQTGPVTGEPDWQVPARVPAEMTRPLLSGAVSWEKFVMDVHSGRVLGITGTWLADLLAIALIVMSMSGLILSRAPPRHGCRNGANERSSPDRS